MVQTEITIRQPIYIGLSIVDISKVVYNDTDSLVYFIKDIDVYEVMKKV